MSPDVFANLLGIPPPLQKPGNTTSDSPEPSKGSGGKQEMKAEYVDAVKHIHFQCTLTQTTASDFKVIMIAK